MTKERTYIEKWWDEYAENPIDALHRLLCRQVFMGTLNRNETDEILFRLFHNKSGKTIRQLDATMKQWFTNYWGKIPGSLSSGQWADTLQNAFIAVSRLDLGETTLFLRDTYTRNKSWLRSLYLGPARDPEGDLLRTLALAQKDHSLLPLWMRICRMEEDLPIDYAPIGLMGLRKLPETDGSPQGDLPAAFFKGVVCLAEALAKRKIPRAMNRWLSEIRAITALYPRSKQYWATYFFPFLDRRPESPTIQWLDKAIPKLSNYFKPKRAAYIQPPPYEKVKHFVKLIKTHPLEKIRGELEVFLGEHRRYAYQTGDPYFLVRTFSNIGYKLSGKAPAFALEFVEEAFDWEPYNPVLWSQRAIIEAVQGNVSRAAALLWEARRRFPEDSQIRNKLAHLMEKQGKYNIAETLYRQAVEDFPQDAVCRAGLADVLKAQGRLDEAEVVYRETMKRFPKNAVCRTGLATVLLKQGKREEGISILKGTTEIFPGNKVANGLLQRVTQGHEISAEDEKALQLETVESVDREIDFDVLLPDQAADIHEVPAEKHEDLMEKALAKSGASLIAAKKPPEYGDSPSPTAIQAVGNEIEIEIGEITLEHRRSRTAGTEEREKSRQRLAGAVEKTLEKSPGNIPALMLKGLLLADNGAGEAGTFFSQQAQYHPNTIGFHLLQLRLETLKNKPVAHHRWQDLTRDFPCRSTIIKLEYVLDLLKSPGNSAANPMEEAEKLRRRLSKDPEQLPFALQKSEEWVKEIIDHELFKDIDTKKPFPSRSLDAIKENFKEKETFLRGTVDQCLSAAII